MLFLTKCAPSACFYIINITNYAQTVKFICYKADFLCPRILQIPTPVIKSKV